MNLRDTRLSSRSVIPVALALPIPVERRLDKEREQRHGDTQRRAEREPSKDESTVVDFYL